MDVESGTVVAITDFTIEESTDAALVVGTTYTEFDGDVTYVSGSYQDGSLIVEVNGVQLTIGECVSCQGCN
jgi:hypothetical protein